MWRERNVFHKRKFLSTNKNSNANINASIFFEPDFYNKDGKFIKGMISGSIKLSDCDRTINFDAHGWGKKEQEQTLKKLDNLIEILQEYREVYATYMEEL